MKAPAAGVPLVCLPWDVTRTTTQARVVYQDAGVRLSPSASSTRIAEAITTVLREAATVRARNAWPSVLEHELAQNDVVSEFESIPLAARRQMAAETA
jgi:UDP:flavonoid glycosyltransferase YjiC (YdhE family)